MLYTNPANEKNRKTSTLKFAVYCGGNTTKNQFQVEMDLRILNRPLGTEITIEYVDNKKIRENRCKRFSTPDDFVDWLLEASAYFIVCQGCWLGLLTSDGKRRMDDNWTVATIDEAMTRLVTSGRCG